MKVAPFEYARPDTLEDALQLLGEPGNDAKPLAGGQSLVPLMSYRLALPAMLVDINGLAELDRIELTDEGLSIGALTRQVRLERHPGLSGRWGAVRDAIRNVGHLPTRTRGTVGGSIAHADPSAELPLVVAALDAAAEVTSVEGPRRVVGADLFRGPLMTTLKRNELITRIDLPAPPPNAVSGLEEFHVRSGDFAIAAVSGGVATERGVCTWLRLAAGGVGATPVRFGQIEEELVGSRLGAAELSWAGRTASEAVSPTADLHGSAEFRAELVGSLVEELLSRLAAEAAA